MNKKLEFSEKDFLELSHLIPPNFEPVIRMVGFETSWKMVKKWHGTFVPVGQNRRGTGKKLHAMLVSVVGCEEKAQKLETAFFAQRGFYVPKCEAAFRELRNRRLRADFDELTTQQPHPMPAYLAARNLALEYDLSERRVWEVLKRPDSERQTDLFDMAAA